MWDSRILGGYDDPTQQLLLRAPEVLIKSKNAVEYERRISWWRRRRINKEHHQSGGERRARLQVGKQDDEQKRGCDGRTCLGMAIFVALRLAQIAAVATCIVLSLNRLKKQDYVDPQHKGAEDHRNIRWSLNIFYGLVFTQGIIFIVLRTPVVWALVFCTIIKYRLYGPSGRIVVDRYWRDNYLAFITGNWRATLNMNLITFAKQLAVSDIAVDDQLVGIRAMDRILRSEEYSSLALAKLRASLDTDVLGKLIDMLGFTGTRDEEDMRGHASRVLLKLAPDILLDTFPQATYLITSSLLKSTASNMDVDFIWFGLRILDELTNIQQNCRQAEKLIDLLPKIIDLTNLNLRCCHGSRRVISDPWIEQEIIPLLQREEDIPTTSIRKIDQEIIVGMALKILSKLVATPGDAGKKLRKEASANIQLLADTGIILGHVGAARVVACLALDEKEKIEIGRSPEIIKKLKECLLSKAAHVDTTKVAAKLLLLEYTNNEQLSQIKSSIQDKNINLPEDEGFSVPTMAFIEALDLDQLLPPWMQKQPTTLRILDLEDVLSAERVNHCEAAAKALAVLTSGCEENAVAVLEEITVKEMEMIVEMLFPRNREESRRRMYARLQPETIRLVNKIACATEEDRVRTTSVNAKLLQNLRAHGGTEKFIQHMRIIDQALPQVLKGIVDQVAKLEQPGCTNENLANDDGQWVEAGKVFESFICLTVQICYCLDASGFAKALVVANLTVDTLVLKLKKILELYKYPTTDFPSIRRATLELMTWMVGNNKYRETILQCGVYEQLKEVAKTGGKLESFQLFHCDVGVGRDHTSSISSLVSNLRAQLELCPDFHERSRYYGEHARTITVLLA
ncbi:uncharacterized protein LOC124665467 [Lolium rigidum]|uniref:uncharacterized protein LOC124665467 n=1 Tax=Lolium rigidum TaxID=89674 RepID=UPI001F5DDBBF|nr:uncharacterized protein LOC124665467 [Lolium rigidum]